MSREGSEKLIEKYYDAFNKKNMKNFISLLDNNVTHDINQGHSEIGKEKFELFMERMNQCYEENLHNIVIMSNSDGSRVAAEYVVNGKYLKGDVGLPEAKGQQYTLPGGAFFEIHNDKITRVTNYYNVTSWLKLVK